MRTPQRQHAHLRAGGRPEEDHFADGGGQRQKHDNPVRLLLFLREMTGFSGALQPSHWRGPPSPQALSYRLAETGDLRSVFVRRIEPLRETQAGDPILAALQEIS